MHPSVSNIKHVVVLMMENRSYDHLLFDYPGATSKDNGNNRFSNKDSPQAPMSATGPFDLVVDDKHSFCPSHEFDDVMQQIGTPVGNKYPMDGFVADADKAFPSSATITPADKRAWLNKVMQYVPFGTTPEQDPLPAFQGLARNFAVCDQWYASVPGPTWPNRFFALMGTCRGRVLMPNKWTDTGNGIATFLKEVCADSIFSLLEEANKTYKLYADCATPLAFMTKGAGTRETIAQFVLDAHNGELPEFSWIEPDYGLLGPHGNSQHPPEDLRFGDKFIATIFNAITANPQVWSKTLFVLLYDEHGGFYDRESPRKTVAPDNCPADVPFDFEITGVRVPAILASPWIKPGLMTMDDTFYDHTSLLAFLRDHFGLAKDKLGKRVKNARHFGTDVNLWADAIRADVTTLQLGAPPLPQAQRLLATYETELATETRRMIQATHAYLTGGDPDAAAGVTPSRALTRPGHPVMTPTAKRDLPDLPSAEQLGAMVERVVQLMHAAAPTTNSPPPKKSARSKQAVLPDGGRAATAPAPGTLRILAIHGVGHGDAPNGSWSIDPNWQAKWTEVIRAQLAALGIPETEWTVSFMSYDDLFGTGPTLLQIAKGIGSLIDALCPPSETATRNFSPMDLDDLVRWTAGMTVQWMEDPALRQALCERLLSLFRNNKPDLVLAHSMGSLIAYDTFLHEIAAGNARLLDGTMLATFGSQIAHPVVIREVWGGLVQPLHDKDAHGIAHWFHLYNPKDKVFTRPIRIPDPARSDILDEFTTGPLDGLFSTNHSAEVYMSNEPAHRRFWPAIAQRQAIQPSLPRMLTMFERSRTVTSTRRRALLVGVNNYPDTRIRLNGCVNDVYLMSEMLQESGYASADIRVLTDDRATRTGIMERLQWLVEDARPGDERVFFYSGHGAQVPTYGAGGYADHMCETLVPYDFDWEDPDTYFTDREFHHFYTNLPFSEDKRGESANLIAVFDCCYAGGMTRAAGVARTITMPPDIQHRMLQWDPKARHWTQREFLGSGQPRSFTDDGKSNLTRGWCAQGTAYGLRPFDQDKIKSAGARYGHSGPYMPTLLYAAKQYQLANECAVGPAYYGAFTYAVVEEIRRARATTPLTFSQLMKEVTDVLRAGQNGQTPELVAPTKVRNQLFPWR